MATQTKVKTLLSAVVLDDDPTNTTSAAVKCESYNEFRLFITTDSTSSPTDVLYEVELSPDGTNYYKHTEWFWGDLRYEDTATASGLSETMTGSCAGATHFRVKATGTGTDGSNSFTVTVGVVFFNE